MKLRCPLDPRLSKLKNVECRIDIINLQRSVYFRDIGRYFRNVLDSYGRWQTLKRMFFIFLQTIIPIFNPLPENDDLWRIYVEGLSSLSAKNHKLRQLSIYAHWQTFFLLLLFQFVPNDESPATVLFDFLSRHCHRLSTKYVWVSWNLAKIVSYIGILPPF